MKEDFKTLAIANQIIELAKELKKESTMSHAELFQAPPPNGGKRQKKERIQASVIEKRLSKIKR